MEWAVHYGHLNGVVTMTVQDVLADALAAVEGAKIPDDLRQVAFAKAVDLLGPGIPAPVGRAGAAPRATEPATSGALDGLIGKIALRLKLADDVVGEVYHDEGGALEIMVPPTKLKSSKSQATKEIALLVAGGRQAAGLEEFTSVDEIRKVATEYKKYDQANFATAISAMSDVFNFRGSGKSKLVKVSKPGWDEVNQLVGRLGGAEA
jgi:hypothetical protein